jgi:hypothetical protein
VAEILWHDVWQAVLQIEFLNKIFYLLLLLIFIYIHLYNRVMLFANCLKAFYLDFKFD